MPVVNACSSPQIRCQDVYKIAQVVLPSGKTMRKSRYVWYDLSKFVSCDYSENAERKDQAGIKLNWYFIDPRLPRFCQIILNCRRRFLWNIARMPLFATRSFRWQSPVPCRLSCSYSSDVSCARMSAKVSPQYVSEAYYFCYYARHNVFITNKLTRTWNPAICHHVPEGLQVQTNVIKRMNDSTDKLMNVIVLVIIASNHLMWLAIWN